MGLVSCMVRREGFEPSKDMPDGLQPSPFNHLDTDARICQIDGDAYRLQVRFP